MVLGAEGRVVRQDRLVTHYFMITVSGNHGRWGQGGPFGEIVQHEIFVNCILLSSKIPPFIDHELVADQGPGLERSKWRRLGTQRP